MLAQLLIVAGALLFGLLGTVHLAYTFFTNKFDARDASTTVAMKATSPVLTRRTSLWKAWIGFNASHSLGLLLFAAVYLILAIGHMPLLQQSPALVWLPVFGGASYLVLASLFWFHTPLIGVGIASTCFVVAALMLAA
jgi:hypothetical protein